MMPADLQALCELGSEQLIRLEYLAAEATLAQAELIAWQARDFDTLARLYMPLQETRRQRRQRCGEGTVRLDLLATSPTDQPDPTQAAAQYPNAQLLLAGYASIAPSLQLRNLQHASNQYAETFLAAVYPIIGGQRAIVIVPTADITLPPPAEYTIDTLLPILPPHCITLHESELPIGPRPGTPETYGQVMSLWERLHLPFLAAADMQADPIRKIDYYRRTIEVDYACELAHQKLSSTAKVLSRQHRA